MQERLSIHKDNTKEQNTQAILEVINYVEWDRVYKAMVTLDWTWAGTVVGVPTVDNLKKMAFSLAQRCVDEAIEKERNTYSACGGIEVRVQWFQEGDVGIDVNFVLSGWNNYL